jgi:hypothetical protein
MFLKMMSRAFIAGEKLLLKQAVIIGKYFFQV